MQATKIRAGIVVPLKKSDSALGTALPARRKRWPTIASGLSLVINAFQTTESVHRTGLDAYYLKNQPASDERENQLAFLHPNKHLDAEIAPHSNHASLDPISNDSSLEANSNDLSLTDTAAEEDDSNSLDEVAMRFVAENQRREKLKAQDHPLLRLIRTSNLRAFQSHLRKGSYDVNMRDEHGRGIVHYGALLKDNNNNTLRLILKRPGLNVNNQVRLTGQTALHLACSTDAADAAKLLLENGADPNARDNDRRTPLHAAIIDNASKVFDLLLEQPALEINAEDATGVTPLLEAVTLSRLHMLGPLVAKGADLRSMNSQGLMPLHVAVKLGEHRCIYVLVEAIVRARLGEAATLYKTANDALVNEAPEGIVSQAKQSSGTLKRHEVARIKALKEEFEREREGKKKLLLAEKEAFNRDFGPAAADDPINAPNAAGDTPLHMAACTLPKKLVALLIKRGADPSLKNAAGETPYDIARDRSREKSLLELLAPYNGIDS